MPVSRLFLLEVPHAFPNKYAAEKLRKLNCCLKHGALSYPFLQRRSNVTCRALKSKRPFRNVTPLITKTGKASINAFPVEV
jgi:hypothetical protein